jgi:hypothetical protein
MVSLVQYFEVHFLACRFAIDTMQSVCLDEFGGEKAVDLGSQETTLIQHIFGGHLQSQVMHIIRLNPRILRFVYESPVTSLCI